VDKEFQASAFYKVIKFDVPIIPQIWGSLRLKITFSPGFQDRQQFKNYLIDRKIQQFLKRF